MYDKVRYHLVVDMLNDFISGPMACTNAENAMNHIITYINAHPEDGVLYVCDAHPANHCSFVQNGGAWPAHCIKNTRGQEIHLSFYTCTREPRTRPHLMRIFNKGTQANEEQYSGFNAKCTNGDILHKVVGKKIVVSGLATEYCVLNTVKDFLEAGVEVSVLLEGLAYVNVKDHKAALDQMRSLGAKFI